MFGDNAALLFVLLIDNQYEVLVRGVTVRSR